jgi:hypothetical protein
LFFASAEMASFDLERFRVHCALSDLFYVPDYVSEAEEASLLTHVSASMAAWRQASVVGLAWVLAARAVRPPPPAPLTHKKNQQVSGRRLQNHGGNVEAKGLIPAPMPAWLRALCERVARDTRIYGAAAAGSEGSQPGPPQQLLPNHVLINAYAPGEGIMVRASLFSLSSPNPQTTPRAHSSAAPSSSNTTTLPQIKHHSHSHSHARTHMHTHAPPPTTTNKNTKHTKPHEDGPLYHAAVAILSTGAPAVLRFWRKRDEGGLRAVMPFVLCCVHAAAAVLVGACLMLVAFGVVLCRV